MTDLRTPVKDIRFALDAVTQLGRLTQLPAFPHVDSDLVNAMIDASAKLADDVIAPTHRSGDRDGVHMAHTGVTVPPAFHRAYEKFVAGGWSGVLQPERFGGGGFPLAVAMALRDPVVSANLSFSMGPFLASGVASLIAAHASEEQKQRFLPPMVSGEWLGTMNLTEPEAGSDIGATSCSAVPAEDGTYRVKGQKIFITYGDHDLTEQIIHLVLARLPGSPPGSKGLTLLIVPKRMVEADGSLGAHNDVVALSTEAKLGIHGSPTCVMAFGANSDGAVAEIIGEPGDGIRQMFTLMNEERLGVGLQGVATAERAFQSSLAYAGDRRQGRSPGSAPGIQVPIIEHPDVQRMILTMKSCLDAMRLLCYSTALAVDRGEHDPDSVERERQRKVADLLTPVVKAWCSDTGIEMASLAIQVHGGMGYVEETGVAQLLRDARCTSIYEGTNGIQAIDLALRKLHYDDGDFVRSYLDDLESDIDDFAEALTGTADALRSALKVLREAVAWVLEPERETRDVLAGAPHLLEMFGLVVAGVWLGTAGTVAQRALLEGEGSYPPRFLASKLTLANFFARSVLPRIYGAAVSLRAGSATLAELDATAIAP